MKHNWVDNNSQGIKRLGEDLMRKCTICGTEQAFVGEWLWGRIGQRRWEPLVGKCKVLKET